jgi:predicted cupin superfamily sugar epimerase
MNEYIKRPMQDMNSMIEALSLLPHPEGGFYKETYRSKITIQSTHHAGEKSAYTAIYYLLGGKDFSSWHRIQSDETWFFHSGCDVSIYFFDDQKVLRIEQLGMASMNLQFTIPANTWFAAKPMDETSFSLVSCAVGPGFEFDDFEIGKRNALLAEFGDSTQNIQAINTLTRS